MAAAYVDPCDFGDPSASCAASQAQIESARSPETTSPRASPPPFILQRDALRGADAVTGDSIGGSSGGGSGGDDEELRRRAAQPIACPRNFEMRVVRMDAAFGGQRLPYNDPRARAPARTEPRFSLKWTKVEESTPTSLLGSGRPAAPPRAAVAAAARL